jgi:hypothetical protein
VKTFFAFLVLFIFSVPSIAQYRELLGEDDLQYVQQSDSIYRVNRVKVRRAYEGYDYPIKKKLHAEIFFDDHGRVLQINYEPYVDGQTRISYYSYKADGRLATFKDVFIKGAPNPGLKELMEKEAYEKKINAIPDHEEHNYTIQYEGDSLTSLIAINESGVKISESIFSDDGLLHERHYFKGVHYNTSSRYLRNRYYRFLPVYFKYAFKDLRLNESQIEYTFDKNDLLRERIVNGRDYAPYYVKFVHEKNGLLKSIGRVVVFEYEFWE